MSQPSVTVSERGAERILSGHLWVYRSDVLLPAGAEGESASAEAPDAKRAQAAIPEPGALVEVLDRRRRHLGHALFSSKSQIALRLMARERRPFDRAFLVERIRAAIALRETVAADAEAYRVISSEGDLLPSLVVDRYRDCLVLQTLSQGMERLKPTLVEILQELFQPRSIVERNDSPVRVLENLPEQKGVLAGEEVTEVVAEDNGIKLIYDLLGGQKTGGYLDQRENRAAAAGYARGRVLDCFTYTGAFALSMARHAASVLAVDASNEALETAKRNQALNAIDTVDWRQGNCFDFLKAADQAGERFDTIVLDPPAFARQKSNLEGALRGYKELNLRALKLLAPGGFLITCSCSYHVSEADFMETVAMASLDAHRRIQVVERRTQSRDHPILLTVPETHYLKCLILRVPD